MARQYFHTTRQPVGTNTSGIQRSFLEMSASGQEAIAHLDAALSILATIRKVPVAMLPQKELREDM
jgi:hypothetical protein